MEEFWRSLKFSVNWPHWANSVIELSCPCEFPSKEICWTPSKIYFFQTAKKEEVKNYLDPPIRFFSSWQWWYYLHRSRDSVSPVHLVFILCNDKVWYLDSKWAIRKLAEKIFNVWQLHLENCLLTTKLCKKKQLSW